MAIYLVLLAAICAILLTKIARLLYNRYQLIRTIDKIPGAKAYPLIGNLLDVLNLTREDLYGWMQAMNQEYPGGIFRSWAGIQANVHLNTAESVSVIMSHKDLITKAESYDFFHPWLGRGLLTSKGDEWHRHRKLITPTFHFTILEDFAEVMSEKAEILKQCIASELNNDPNAPLDMYELLTRCALDIICESAMGVNINAQTDHRAEYSVALHSISIQTVKRVMRPWLHADWIYYRTSRGKEFKHTVEISHNFTNQVINERKLAREIQKQNPDEDFNSGKKKRQAFLDHLLDACDRDDMPFTNEELRDQVNTFMFAGHDTTAGAMSFALFCIGNNPEVEEKIHQEQLEVFGDSKEPATLHQLSKLKYLERVIKETLRLFPSAPSISRNLTEDVEILGYKIPKNVTVLLEIHQVHRDPKYWPDPEKFDPDRFLPENSHGRHPYAFVPFSAGPRNCIGQKYALLEEKIVLTAILRTWKVKSLLKYHEARCYSEIVLKPQQGIKINFTPK